MKLLLTILLSAAVLAQVPDISYPSFTPSGVSGSENQNCYATAPPTVNDPSNIFVAYACIGLQSGSRTSKIAHIDMQRRNSGLKWTVTTPGVIFRSPMIVVNPQMVLAYTYDAAQSVVGLVSATQFNPVWQLDRYNATSGIAYTSFNRLVFIPMGAHPMVVANQTTTRTSLLAVYASNGSTYWETPFEATASLGTPIYTEGRILMMHDYTLKSFWADSGWNNPIQYARHNPCGLTPVPGTTLQMSLVTFGEDENGPLKALYLYGQTVNPSSPGATQFSICRAHHGAYNFGLSEWDVNFPYNVTVNDISAGGGYVWISMMNNQDSSYHVLLLNPTNGTTVMLLNRSSVDSANYPVALTDPVGQVNSVLLYQQNGATVARRLYGDFGIQWTRNDVQCARKPAVVTGGSTSRAVCVARITGLTVELNYEGATIWTYTAPNTAFFAPQIYAETNVFIQDKINIVGVSFEASLTSAPAPASGGTSAGVVVLIIFVIIFAILLAGAVFKVIRSRGSGTKQSRAQLDKEGYAGLNA